MLTPEDASETLCCSSYLPIVGQHCLYQEQPEVAIGEHGTSSVHGAFDGLRRPSNALLLSILRS